MGAEAILSATERALGKRGRRKKRPVATPAGRTPWREMRKLLALVLLHRLRELFLSAEPEDSEEDHQDGENAEEIGQKKPGTSKCDQTPKTAKPIPMRMVNTPALRV